MSLLARVLGIDFLPGTDAQNTAFSEQEVRKSGSQEVRKRVEKPSDDAIRELLKTKTAKTAAFAIEAGLLAAAA